MSQSVELKAVKAVRKSKTAKAVAKPAIEEPVVAKPVVAKPVVAKPVVAKPVVAKPVVAEPVVAKPVVAEPTPEEIATHFKNRKNLVRLTPENASQYIGDGALFMSRGQYIIKEILGATEKCIQIDHPDLKDHLQLVSRVAYVVPKKIVAPAVAKPVVAPAVAKPVVKPASKVVKKIKIKSLPVVEEPVVKKNHWMTNASRIKKVQPMAIIWEHVEDISDDENDTPQAAGKRLSTMKATRDQIRRRAYRSKVAELQFAGLFLNWEEQEPLQTCPREYISAKRSKRVSTVMYP
jgi:hypothetical protein